MFRQFVQIRNSSLLVQQSAKFITTQLGYYKINKCLASYYMHRFSCVELFDKAFFTFHVRFISMINVDKTTKAFVILSTLQAQVTFPSVLISE